MNIYKLGTIWGKGNPDFYNLIKSESISISHTNDCYPEKGSIILIAKGFTIKAITILLEDCHPVTDNLDFEDKFEPFKVDYDENVLFAKSKWIELEEKDFFQYKTQDGICQVHKPEIHKITKNLILKYTKNDNMKEFVTILEHKNQIILQGPPGTGKTFTAKDIAEQMICNKVSSDKKEQRFNLENSDQYKLIQFHPAYSYEDFVRGIVAESNGNNIDYKTKNKLLADFANLALCNYEDSFKNPKQVAIDNWFNSQFDKFVIKVKSDIDDKGEYILDKKTSYIRDIKDDDIYYYNKEYTPHDVGFKISKSEFKRVFLSVPSDSNYYNITLPDCYHYKKLILPLLTDFRDGINEPLSNFNHNTDKELLKPYILIIDEINRANLPAVLGELIYALEYRGESVESMYELDNNRSLILPPNLYIIGTMNTADRSVGHIDYAIRRRFAFVDILPHVLLDNFELDKFKLTSTLFIKNIDDYIANPNVELIISDHLSEEFRPHDVWLGHSYFISKNCDFSLRVKYEITPILKEYIKDGILKNTVDVSDIINKLNK